MGYNLTIGEAKIYYDPEYLVVGLTAENVTHPDAPDHDSFVGKSNKRMPSYVGWRDFCRDAGIEPLFYGEGWGPEMRRRKPCQEGFHRETPLLNEHPGTEPICKGDFDYIREARIRREKTNGGKQPGFESDDLDDTLARLLWLEFWMGWALENCKIPVFHNSRVFI